MSKTVRKLVNEKYTCPICNTMVANYPSVIMIHNTSKRHMAAVAANNNDENQMLQATAKKIHLTTKQKVQEYRSKLNSKVISHIQKNISDLDEEIVAYLFTKLDINTVTYKDLVNQTVEGPSVTQLDPPSEPLNDQTSVCSEGQPVESDLSEEE